MSCLGVHYAIDENLAEKLIQANDDEELVGIVQEEIEEAWDKAHLFETDKAWDALQRCLSDGTLNVDGGTPPLNKCFFGGGVLNEDPDYFVVLLTPIEVNHVAEALKNASRQWLRERYDSMPFPDYDGEKTDEDFDYTWDQFRGLPEFFARAAEERLHVIFTVDQ